MFENYNSNRKSCIVGTGFYVPDTIVTNSDNQPQTAFIRVPVFLWSRIPE